ncbi:MAG: HAD-IC family P-type ATPase [Candidatus Wildermuthbacteria bacterium]|nr:HAD-IC family P-type ATPase [Candidatus Wildermuthbacteria bacterium]
MEHLWHLRTVSETFEELGTGEHGLNEAEAKRRLKTHGRNKLPETKTPSIAAIFLRQFQSPLIYVLFGASALVFAMGQMADAFVIFAVLLFNALVGTVQEGKAQNTLHALKTFVETKATVVREGKELIISDEEVAPGDILILQEGEKVPADARIIFSQNLTIDESALTGESEPVHKILDVLEKPEAGALAQKNMALKGTNIVAGSGKAVAVATGLVTAIGKVAKEVSAIDTEIPLKANIRALTRLIIATAAFISAALFILGIVFGAPVRQMFVTVVSLSVSIIPEGLPIVMTLVLATGVWRMSKRNALVKRLQAVEALGQARVIAVDKTGTITKNELMIEKVYVGGKMFDIGGSGYDPAGEVRLNGNMVDAVNHPELLFAARTAAFCASARVVFSQEQKQWRIAGDPTEAALLVFARKLGFHKDELKQESPLIAEIPFDYKLKYHATVHKEDGRNLLVLAGAPEVILRLSETAWRGGKSHALERDERESLELMFSNMSQNALRVLAFAVSHAVSDTLDPKNISSLTFGGFFAMRDALRPEAAPAVRRAKEAGINVVMITGDHKETAQAIAKEAGIFQQGDTTLTGQDIDSLSDKELSQKLAFTSVFSRVTPTHKLRIVQAYKARGEIVAMTGDGVNDAPSLVAADLGVAMGKIGTEVAREAADIVLLDDNFGSIVAAVEEGRNIYKTIKKVILYLFSTSFGEVFTIVLALLLGYPLPLLPAQIIWLNFVTDGFLDVALAMEPKEKGLMKGNFERPKRYLVDKLMAQRMFFMALPMAVGALYLFSRYAQTDFGKALTISLTALAVFQWLNAWNCRSEEKSVFAMNPFSNMFLVAATAIVIGLQALAVYNPVLQKLLHTTPLAFSEWLMIVPIALSIIIVEETRKFFYRRSAR